nr:YetF domain-containing protein [Lysinibacillus fusiformis]
MQNVAVALWEPDGSSTSSFLHTQHQTTTPTNLNLNPQPFFLPIILIKEGKIDYHELQKTEQTED